MAENNNGGNINNISEISMAMKIMAWRNGGNGES
jgi:hypothetical protein